MTVVDYSLAYPAHSRYNHPRAYVVHSRLHPMALKSCSLRAHCNPWTNCNQATFATCQQSRCCVRSNKLLTAASTTRNSEQIASSVADVWATEVWSLPAAPRPVHTSHVVYGLPPRLGDLLTLQPEKLHPANITKAALLECLQLQLISRQAAKQALQGIILSGPYLPSQIDMVFELASSLQLCTKCFVSGQQLHVLVSRQPALQTLNTLDTAAQQRHPELNWIPLLSSELCANIQPLPEGRLQAARDTEQQLTQQLRLFSPIPWTNALQQKLLSRKRTQTVIAVRSLMGPAALDSVRKLVSKLGLYLYEVEREFPSADSDTSTSRKRRSSSSIGSSRRRIKTASSETAQPADSGSHAECDRELVVLVSVIGFESEDLADLPEHVTPETFTDYMPGGLSEAKDSRNKESWWKLDWGKWFVRESEAEA